MNTGHQAELLAAAELMRRGAWTIHFAPGGCPQHDLIAWKPGRYVRIQVKGCESGETWQMRSGHEAEQDPDLFFIFVSLSPATRYWVVPAADVAAYCRDEHQEWLAARPGRRTNAIRKWRGQECWAERWDVLG